MKYHSKITVVLISLGLAIGAIVGLIIIPTVNEIHTLKTAIYDERVDLERKFQRGQLLRQTLEDFERVKPYQQLFDSAFVVKDSELEFIQAIEVTASQHNIAQKISLTAVPDNGQEIQKVPLTLTLQGNFTNILRYLQALERLNFYYTVPNINIQSGGVGSGNSIITLVLSGSIYSHAFTDAEPLPAQPAAEPEPTEPPADQTPNGEELPPPVVEEEPVDPEVTDPELPATLD